jgi:hypothetical protein
MASFVGGWPEKWFFTENREGNSSTLGSGADAGPPLSLRRPRHRPSRRRAMIRSLQRKSPEIREEPEKCRRIPGIKGLRTTHFGRRSTRAPFAISANAAKIHHPARTLLTGIGLVDIAARVLERPNRRTGPGRSVAGRHNAANVLYMKAKRVRDDLDGADGRGRAPSVRSVRRDVPGQVPDRGRRFALKTARRRRARARLASGARRTERSCCRT